MKQVEGKRRGWIRGAALLSALALVPAGFGCSSGEGRLPVVPVEGSLSVSGESPAGALLVFHPIAAKSADAPRPSAKVGEDGRFRVTTYDGDDGAPEGEYAVTAQWFKLVKKGADSKAGPNVIPAEYGKPESTPWKVTVGGPKTVLEPRSIQPRK